MANEPPKRAQDDYRLPEGMKRIGYDADTQRYTFQRGNKLFLGEPGSKYGGHLTGAGTAAGEILCTLDVIAVL